MKMFFTTTAAAALLATAASAQMFGADYGTDLDRTTFDEGFQSTGYYDAVDRDDNMMIDRSEYATGLYRSYDTDRDLEISRDEFETGYDRDMGMSGQAYDASMFDTYDADASGTITQDEFGGYYGDTYTPYYDEMDVNADEMLDQDEYTTGLYEAADRNEDMVISIEEEGFFEGWFDGDDIEAEIESVGDVYNDDI
ncbi:EF hand [Jannaschia seosinensis]|uniref:EF hand n=1 Tax=Jannaschia seosinensis TaxID=313367 RepID=A0A0M7B806_9RHOB|nr:hypothetical protein [Jannaschia seosinensis]CUH30964.1 EF hand [Jannaschia seosinensis]